MYPIKSRAEWFGHAGKPGKVTSTRAHNGKSWETSVGGMRNTVRAIYGSTDHASEDHRNDPLCHVVTDVKVCDNLGRVVHLDTFGITEFVPPTQEEHAQEVARLVRRATKLGMTLVEYAAMVGVKL